jgi:hypothetical protein
MLRGFFLIQNRSAVPAHCHSRLHFFTARRAIGHARRDVSPSRPMPSAIAARPMRIGSLTKRKPPRPHGVAIGHQPLGRRGPRFFGRRKCFPVSARILPGVAHLKIRIQRCAQMFRLNLSRRIRISAICRGASACHLRTCAITKIQRQLIGRPRGRVLRVRIARFAFHSMTSSFARRLRKQSKYFVVAGIAIQHRQRSERVSSHALSPPFVSKNVPMCTRPGQALRAPRRCI